MIDASKATLLRRQAVAEAIARHRDAIVAEVLASVSDGGMATIGNVVAAQRLVDLAAQCEYEGDYSAFLEGADRFPSDAPAHPVARNCINVTAAVLRSNGEIDDASMAYFDELSATVRRRIGIDARPIRAIEAIDDVDVAIGRLVAQLDTHDPLTSEHSRAVGSWCTRIARRLRLDDRTARFLGRCGLIHDIGKARVPRAVLTAPRKLNQREWSVMREHVTAGERIAAREDVLHEHLPAIRSHHERLDGSGYPDGLSGDDLPFSARVVAVADCFNAMIGRRPYRPALPPSRALDELIRLRGTHFDPEIVDAMIVVVTGVTEPGPSA
jgi:putative nucleotidyltransferase with HDIG domain